MLTFQIVARTAALVALVGVSGCSQGLDTTPPVSASELQETIIAKLAHAETPSAWVNCPRDLPGKVGATTRCDVKFSSENSVTALLTATQVRGDKVSWEITGPELTKEQVAKRVAGLTSSQEATCDSGLEARAGDWVQCQVTRNGTTSVQTVEVIDVKGLIVNLGLTALIPQQQLEDAVLMRLTPLYGRRPDKAECGGGLAGVVGDKMGCVVTVGDNLDNYVATVTGLSGGAIDFVVAIPSAANPDDYASQPDMCHGCPG